MQEEFEMEIDAQEEMERRRRSAQRRAQMKREKERYLLRMKLLQIGVPVVLACILAVVFVIKGVTDRKSKEENLQSFPVTVQASDAYKNIDSELSMLMEDDPAAGQGEKEGVNGANDPAYNGSDATSQEALGDGTNEGEQSSVQSQQISSERTSGGVYTVTESDSMQPVSKEVVSSAAILIDRSSEQIISQRDARARISPASMTKILTVLVAAEHVTDLDDTFTITRDITDYGYVNDCSSAGFLEDETVTIRDLFYGTVLPSGADAAVGLATYVAGSQEAFVEMMNEKLSQMGLASTTHMTNCVGIYDEQHYSTALDMALILEAAVDDPLCREVLSAHTYTTSVTEQHPEGIIISNWFLRRIEDKDTHGEVVGAKTGYVVQSGSCAASYAEDKDGNGYICVTAGSTSSWRCIYDHVALYQQFLQASS